MEDLKTKKYGDLYNHLCSAQFIADEIGDDLADEILKIREKIGKKLLDEYGIKHDLEKEVEDWVKTGPHTSYPWCTIPDAIRITAEHFFELGLKAKGE